MCDQDFKVYDKVTVSFCAEAVRISATKALVQVGVTQCSQDPKVRTFLTYGYCYTSIMKQESLLDVAARVARNPYLFSLRTTWSDDKSPEALQEFKHKTLAYEKSLDAHEYGPSEGWETVHAYHEVVEGVRKLVEVQVAETCGTWYYRTKGSSSDGVYDDPQPTREAAVLKAQSISDDA